MPLGVRFNRFNQPLFREDREMSQDNQEFVRRTGKVLAKGSKLDPEYQEFSVRDNGDRWEYYHKQLGDWCELPREWTDKVVWDYPPEED
jgi:hypothetical protein